ncbi:kinase [Agrobacterium tumefaciens]|uniref:phosphotransferase n=1 Tax=Agrobacterium tumefaciens TaxID=358 RepID=UPI00122FCD06|nr:kinase [Agrobacterium tumefaciens]
MAVFTDLTDSDRDLIATAYRLGPLTSVIGIADGDTETTFLFRSSRGEFIVTLFENGADPLDLERAFRTMETLTVAGIPCPRTIRTEQGAATIMASGKLVAVVGFVHGSLARVATYEKCLALGAIAAQIQTALAKPGRTGTGLPMGSVHGALTKDNVFFVDSKVSGVINFRLRHDAILISELADMLVHWSVGADGKLHGPLAEGILTGFESIRTLSVGEKHALPAFVMAAAAAYFANKGDLVNLEERTHATFISAQSLVHRRG